MTKKEIISECLAIIFVFFFLGFLFTIINQWGSFPSNVDWFELENYSPSSLAIVLIASRTLYCELRSRVNKWIFPLLVVGIWGSLTSLVSYAFTGAFDSAHIITSLIFGTITGVFPKLTLAYMYQKGIDEQEQAMSDENN